MVKELTGKKLLLACRREKREMIILEQRREQILSSLLPKAIKPKLVNVQESITMDPIADKIAASEELREEIERQIGEIIKHETKARKQIGMIKDSRYRQLLGLYYLSFRIDEHGNKVLYTWEKVAREMDYSPQRIYELIPKAIGAMRKVQTESE